VTTPTVTNARLATEAQVETPVLRDALDTEVRAETQASAALATTPTGPNAPLATAAPAAIQASAVPATTPIALNAPRATVVQVETRASVALVVIRATADQAETLAVASDLVGTVEIPATLVTSATTTMVTRMDRAPSPAAMAEVVGIVVGLADLADTVRSRQTTTNCLGCQTSGDLYEIS
jgi:hypothetical protein